MNGEISLATLGGGVAAEKFEEEMTKVIENVLDPNTDAKAKREIVIRVTIKPSADRKNGSIAISAQAKLAPATCYEVRGYFGKDKAGRVHAFEEDPKQITIDDFVQAQEEKVTPLQQQPQKEAKVQ